MSELHARSEAIADEDLGIEAVICLIGTTTRRLFDNSVDLDSEQQYRVGSELASLLEQLEHFYRAAKKWRLGRSDVAYAVLYEKTLTSFEDLSESLRMAFRTLHLDLQDKRESLGEYFSFFAIRDDLDSTVQRIRCDFHPSFEGASLDWQLVASSLRAEEIFQQVAPGKSRPRLDRLERSIHFPPEFKQAGVSILSFFSEIVEHRYPDSDVSVRIEQSGNLVTLVVQSPDGQIETIEKELEAYGQVVMGSIPVEEYAADKIEMVRLSNKLEMAKLEARQTLQLIEVEREQYEKRIAALEDNLGYMRSVFEKSLHDAENSRRTLERIAENAAADTADQILKLATILIDEEGSTTELTPALTELKEKDPSLIDKLNRVIVEGSVSGAFGNALWTAITALPK